MAVVPRFASQLLATDDCSRAAGSGATRGRGCRRDVGGESPTMLAVINGSYFAATGKRLRLRDLFRVCLHSCTLRRETRDKMNAYPLGGIYDRGNIAAGRSELAVWRVGGEQRLLPLQFGTLSNRPRLILGLRGEHSPEPVTHRVVF